MMDPFVVLCIAVILFLSAMIAIQNVLIGDELKYIRHFIDLINFKKTGHEVEVRGVVYEEYIRLSDDTKILYPKKGRKDESF